MNYELSEFGFPMFILLGVGSFNPSERMASQVHNPLFKENAVNPSMVETIGCWVIGNPHLHPQHASLEEIQDRLPELLKSLQAAFQQCWERASLSEEYPGWDIQGATLPLSTLTHAPFKESTFNALTIQVRLEMPASVFQASHPIFQTDVLIPWVESLGLPYVLLSPSDAEDLSMVPPEMFEKDPETLRLNAFISSEALLGVLTLDGVFRDNPWEEILKSVVEKWRLQQLPTSPKPPSLSKKI